MIDEIHDGQQRDVRSKSRIMEENLMVSIGKREIPVRIDSIVYVESRNHKVAVHTTEEEIEYYRIDNPIREIPRADQEIYETTAQREREFYTAFLSKLKNL